MILVHFSRYAFLIFLDFACFKHPISYVRHDGFIFSHNDVIFRHIGFVFRSDVVAIETTFLTCEIFHLKVLYSYTFHRTIPFESTETRVSIAFDVVPEQ